MTVSTEARTYWQELEAYDAAAERAAVGLVRGETSRIDVTEIPSGIPCSV